MASGNWKLSTPRPEFREFYERNGVDAPSVYQNPNGLTALVGHENISTSQRHPDMRWHISVRYGDPGVNGRTPTWEEMVASAHELRPGVPFVIGVPPKSWWMNVHPHVLHLYETTDHALLAAWKAERRGDLVT